MHPHRTIARAIAATMVAAALLTGCGAGTQSPKAQADRERKAAGLAHFILVCPPDLWDRTGGTDHWPGEMKIPATIVKRPDGLISVDISGPNLVDLLKALDRYAHPGWGAADPDPLAVRLYDAIAPVLDRVGTPAAGSATPTTTINDEVPGIARPTPSPTPSRTSTAKP